MISLYLHLLIIMKKWKTMFLLGGPGCGKGTQSNLI